MINNMFQCKQRVTLTRLTFKAETEDLNTQQTFQSAQFQQVTNSRIDRDTTV